MGSISVSLALKALTDLRNEVIELCAQICDSRADEQAGAIARVLAERMRQLKTL